ncbi:FkbM family methyltransferase [Rhizobium sp. 32-5/1]|uniref:FkbM family methyltransferase n=1 Tax=Rhizobium sp. 32-5/1 TaxID=3019602 RepID=UPI00240E05E8|nr:FkbM family methyltransferase [Rhizobium sp. 32-5/1]WEZ84531.1 FkbM family methyltransferase [Rhizobium sp. 32-5/1]
MLPNATQAIALLDAINEGACLFAPEMPRQPLVLYGAGNMGRLARDHLRLVGLDFTMVVDRQADTLSADPAWQGIVLSKQEDVPASVKADSLLAVSIATSAYAPLEADLLADGWQNVVPFYDLAESFRDRHPLSNGWFAGPLGAISLAHTKDVLESWDDDVSRAHHLQFIAWRRLRQEWTFEPAPVANCVRFFIPEIVSILRKDEVFLDAGAHHGSVVDAFIKQTDGAFSQVFAIEPDADSRRHLERMVHTLPANIADRISISGAALDAAPRTRRFHSGLGYASQLAETGQDTIQTTTIDALKLAPSFIKLHLEGGEYDALRGAMQSIHQHRPIVAVTTYHNDDGLWKTPLFMMEHFENYRFRMRLHSWCGTGAVVYAIPQERVENR